MRAYRTLIFGSLLFRHDPDLRRLLRSREPAIFACWHQDFVHTMGYISRYNARRRTYVLASASRDGGIAAAVAQGVGFRKAVRGSSARRGAVALLSLHRLARRESSSFAVVCDGPRPPARELKPGVLHLASRTGLPLWLVRTSYQPTTVLERSWARFHLPHLLSRAVCMAHGPIHVPPDLDRATLERIRQDVTDELNRLADRADEAAAGPESPLRARKTSL